MRRRGGPSPPPPLGAWDASGRTPSAGPWASTNEGPALPDRRGRARSSCPHPHVLYQRAGDGEPFLQGRLDSSVEQGHDVLAKALRGKLEVAVVGDLDDVFLLKNGPYEDVDLARTVVRPATEDRETLEPRLLQVSLPEVLRGKRVADPV